MKKVVLSFIIFFIFFSVFLFYSLPYDKIIEYLFSQQDYSVSVSKITPSGMTNFIFKDFKFIYDEYNLHIPEMQISFNPLYFFKLSAFIGIDSDELKFDRNNIFSAKLNELNIDLLYSSGNLYSNMLMNSLNLSVLNNNLVINEIESRIEFIKNLLELELKSKELLCDIKQNNNILNIKIEFEQDFIRTQRNLLNLIPRDKFRNNVYEDSFYL